MVINPFFIIGAGIAILLLLIIKGKLNPFLALILVSILVGFGFQMNPEQIVNSIKEGVASTLGELALILGFGAMLGAVIADSGAAEVITNKLIKLFGIKNIQWAMITTGFIVGIPLFYSVGFIMLIPIIFVVASNTKLPHLYVGIPMVAALSVTHGFLPPHPAPTGLAGIYEADINLTLLYGLILAVPTIIIAGKFFGSTLKNMVTKPPKKLFNIRKIPAKELPSFASSVVIALLPVFLMTGAGVAKLLLSSNELLYKFLVFIGDPVISLLLAVLSGAYVLGIAKGRKMKDIMSNMSESVKVIAMILLIIGAGGAFKQILVDSGTKEYLTEIMTGSGLSPIILAWLIAALLRISLGSATVAGLTAGGIVAPLIANTSVSPELLVLATGAGSLTFSQVNDTGFWLFKEYFNLSIGETFRSWTLMETIVSIVGLIGCLLLNQIV